HESSSIAGVRFLGNVTRTNAGGGLYENAGGPTTLADSAFTGNVGNDGDGGGLYRGGGGAPGSGRGLFRSDVGRGSDAQGGGVFVAAGDECLLVNVTFSGNNSAYRGGGLFGASAVRVRSSTFAGDVAAEGGALYAASDAKVANTILASFSGGNCAG